LSKQLAGISLAAIRFDIFEVVLRIYLVGFGMENFRV
jgi:hypothetical protein